jgi:hypothetical protein
MIVCPSCRNYVGLSASGGVPPWCPKCGADLKGAPPAPSPQAPAPLPVVQPVGENDPQLPEERIPVVQVLPSAAPQPSPPRMRPMAPLPYEEPSKPKETGLPWWGIIFAIACGIIPVVSLGGAIPAIIGFGGASICLGVAKWRDLPSSLRVGICVFVTIAAWMVFFAFWGLMASVMGSHPGYQPRYRR